MEAVSRTEIIETAVGSSFTGMTLRPVGLNLDSLLGIVESFLVFILGGVNSGTVGEEDVVFGFDSKSLGEFLASFNQFWSGVNVKGGVWRT